MKLAHLVSVLQRGRSGLWESAKEIVEAERRMGIDAWMVDTRNPDADHGELYAKGAFLREVPIVITHSGTSEALNASGKPIIVVQHGEPRASFLAEMNGVLPIYSHIRNIGRCNRVKAVVTLWPEHKSTLEGLVPLEKVRVIPAPVDLKAWTLEGPRYTFGKHRGTINVVCADPWRSEKDPFWVIHAMLLFARKYAGARLHIYGARPALIPRWSGPLDALRDAGALGEVRGRVQQMDYLYRGADMVVTSKDIKLGSSARPLPAVARW